MRSLFDDVMTGIFALSGLFMSACADELEQILRSAGVTIDPNAEYRGSASYENPNDAPSDDAMDADFESVDPKQPE